MGGRHALSIIIIIIIQQHQQQQPHLPGDSITGSCTSCNRCPWFHQAAEDSTADTINIHQRLISARAGRQAGEGTTRLRRQSRLPGLLYASAAVVLCCMQLLRIADTGWECSVERDVTA